jgi:hypothetical protein
MGTEKDRVRLAPGKGSPRPERPLKALLQCGIDWGVFACASPLIFPSRGLRMDPQEGTMNHTFVTPAEDEARVILETHWDGMVPVNVDQIARRLGIEVVDDPGAPFPVRIERPASERTFWQRLLRGWHARGSKIVLGPDHGSRRMVLACMVGHVVLGHGELIPGQVRGGLSGEQEEDARQFAMALLMPASVMGRAQMYAGDSGRLGTLFGVDEMTARGRLLGLGMA